MPRRKSVESIESVPELESVEQAQEIQAETLEQSAEKKRRAPRKKKVEEEAAIEETKSEIIAKIEEQEPEAAIEKNNFDQKWEVKNQQPKQEAKSGESFGKKAWEKIRKPIIAAAFTVSGLLGAKKAAATEGTPKDSTAKETKSNPSLSQQQMRDWNSFVDFLEEKGYKGSRELEANGGILGKELMDEFRAMHPGTTIDINSIVLVQQEMQRTQKTVQDYERRRDNPDAEKMMVGISPVDNKLGHLTSSFKFPLFRQAGTATYPGKEIGLVGKEFPTRLNPKFKSGMSLTMVNGKEYFQDEEGNWQLYRL